MSLPSESVGQITERLCRITISTQLWFANTLRCAVGLIVKCWPNTPSRVRLAHFTVLNRTATQGVYRIIDVVSLTLKSRKSSYFHLCLRSINRECSYDHRFGQHCIASGVQCNNKEFTGGIGCQVISEITAAARGFQ